MLTNRHLLFKLLTKECEIFCSAIGIKENSDLVASHKIMIYVLFSLLIHQIILRNRILHAFKIRVITFQLYDRCVIHKVIVAYIL